MGCEPVDAGVGADRKVVLNLKELIRGVVVLLSKGDICKRVDDLQVIFCRPQWHKYELLLMTAPQLFIEDIASASFGKVLLGAFVNQINLLFHCNIYQDLVWIKELIKLFC